MSELQLLTLNEVRDRLKVSRGTVYAMARSGELPAVKVRGLVRVPAAALERWLEEQKIGGTHE